MSEAMQTPEIHSSASLAETFNELLELSPKLLTNFTPTNAEEQKVLFLSSEQRTPHHVYGTLDSINFDDRIATIREAGQKVLDHPDMNEKFTGAYTAFIDTYVARTELMRQSYTVVHALADEKQAAKEVFMQMNIEQYGKPEHHIYRSLLSEKINKLGAVNAGEKARTIYDELRLLVPSDPEASSEDRFAPRAETVEWMHTVVDSMYGSLLEHVPDDKETFAAEEIRALFEEIVREEFTDEESGESVAADWVVVREKALAIKVVTGEKKIVIPQDRELSREDVKKRIVHEIGVHFFRSVMGEQTDLDPLRLGLDEYYDVEEGLGMVLEQAYVGEAKEAGIDHYITAGLSYFGGKDFRDVFEIKWRLQALSQLKPGQELNDALVTKARNTAYGQVMRSFRGTDVAPWFKDLAYYNGVQETWKHLDEITGDDMQLNLLLLGKASPTAEHRRIILETSTP